MEVSIVLLTPSIFFFFFLQTVFSISPTNSSQSFLCRPDQTISLLGFKNHFLHNNSVSYEYCAQFSFPVTDSWREGTDCCLWEGVQCDESTGNVISLHLSCLYGRIPANSTLFQLSHLRTLYLSQNDFNGSPLSSEFGRLVNLTDLYISYSNFAGMIPSQISHLSKLVTLEIDEYLIFDSLTFEMMLKNLTRLRYLSLDQVNMSAVNPKSFLNLSASVEEFFLHDCLLQGKFPVDVFRLVNLMQFQVSDNPKLTITFPKSNWSSPLDFLSLYNTSLSADHLYSDVNLRSLRTLIVNNCGLRGPIPSFISNLTQIVFLSLTENNITGEIPEFLSNLKQLPTLFLSDNNLRGQVPDFFGNLTMLSSLDLSSNKLVGHLPSSMFRHPKLSYLTLSNNELVSLPSNVTGFSKLIDLYLDSNKLSGSIPSWLFNISSLENLLLSNNQLTGRIPEFHSKSFELIGLAENMLSGPIPESMFLLPNLSALSLSSNNLFLGAKEIEAFQNLKSLLSLDLSYNNLSLSTLNTVDIHWPKLHYLHLSSCNINEIPLFLRTQDKLQALDLSNNNIQGNIPQWLKNVAKETLYYLNLSHNHFTGTLQLPWQNLAYVDLHSNMLQGTLPILPSDINYISLSENKFSGEVSSQICNMSSLDILDLSHNNLTGTIPSCLGNLTIVLSVLNLQMNSFRGKIPEKFAERCGLRNLNLQGNQLEGKIPSSLANCKDLEVLDIGSNMFDDEFPEWLEILPMLRVLILRSNKFHGVLPKFSGNESFSKMQVLDLSCNSFVGDLPNLENLRAMENVDESEVAPIYLGAEVEGLLMKYDYSIALTFKGYVIQMQKILQVFTSIDLSDNRFEGEIPSDIGKLLSLKGLNLSHNILMGRISQSLGDLRNLEWLDLSSNKLVGEIPEQLVDITSLAILNLSNNQLTGHIPEGNQFNTFTIDSYSGNLGLCGNPLPRKCGDEEPKPSTAKMEVDNGMSSFLDHGFGREAVTAGYGFGIVFGVGAGYMMFRYRKPLWLLQIIEEKLRLVLSIDAF